MAMASIRQRQKTDGSTVFHVQVRQAGFPARTASFPTRRLAERWGKTIEAQMIEGRHFRHSESRRRTVAEAIDRYVTEEIPKKRDGSMHRVRLPWWKQQIGNVKLADVTPALLAEMREKLKTQPYLRAKPNSKQTTVPAGQKATEYRRADGTVNRFLSVLSHVFTVARKEWHWVERKCGPATLKGLGDCQGRSAQDIGEGRKDFPGWISQGPLRSTLDYHSDRARARATAGVSTIRASSIA
jgi:hypothetical protein